MSAFPNAGFVVSTVPLEGGVAAVDRWQWETGIYFVWETGIYAPTE